jgi:maleate cis-trans isomerase
MRSVETISLLEQTVGKPVITSNQAMAFQAMQLAGIPDVLPGFGQLLERERA